jgi:hypothetical protein
MPSSSGLYRDTDDCHLISRKDREAAVRRLEETRCAVRRAKIRLEFAKGDAVTWVLDALEDDVASYRRDCSTAADPELDRIERGVIAATRSR